MAGGKSPENCTVCGFKWYGDGKTCDHCGYPMWMALKDERDCQNELAEELV